MMDCHDSNNNNDSIPMQVHTRIILDTRDLYDDDDDDDDSMVQLMPGSYDLYV